MKEFTIYAGEKLYGFVDNPASFNFTCDPSDIDTAYDAIAENAVLNSSQDLIDFQNCKDDDVKTMLNDLVRMGFLSDYECRFRTSKAFWII